MGFWSGMSQGAQIALVTSALAVGSVGVGYAMVGGHDEVGVSTQPSVVSPVDTETTETTGPAATSTPAGSPTRSPVAKPVVKRKAAAVADTETGNPAVETPPPGDADVVTPVWAGRTKPSPPAPRPAYTDFAGCLLRAAPDRCRREFPEEAAAADASRSGTPSPSGS